MLLQLFGFIFAASAISFILQVGVVTVEWTPLHPSEYSGAKVGYEVQWKKSYMIDEEWETVSAARPHGNAVCLMLRHAFSVPNWRSTWPPSARRTSTPAMTSECAPSTKSATGPGRPSCPSFPPREVSGV